MKTIVLGFDALDERYLNQFASSLPNFSALRDRGVEATLESTHPPWTGSAWPSMYTGTEPSDHSVYGFFNYKGYPNEGSLVSRQDVRQPALWNYLSSEGDPSVVMNVPVTHPADPINGVLVPGYLAVEDEPGYPTEIRKELSDSLGEPYKIYSQYETSDQSNEKFDGYLDLIDLRRRAGQILLKDYEWKLAVLQVQKTDAVFHNFSSDNKFRQIYQAADQMLGDVLEIAGDHVNVIVCSDHGMGPVTGYTIYVNEVLRQEGYVETNETDNRPTMSAEKTTLTETRRSNQEEEEANEGDPTTIDRALISAQRTLERVGIKPKDIYTVAERIGLEQALIQLTPDSLRKAAGESVDWRRSRAYCPDGTRMGVRINLEGREPNGIVSRSEYEAVRDELIKILRELETPEGEPAFDFVCRREEVHDGPFTEDAPDILFLPREMNHQVSPTLYGRKFVSTESFDHKRNGVFIAAGPAFSDSAPAQLSLTDVAPITMTALERPIPETMTGTTPDELFATGSEPTRAAYGDVSYGTGGKTGTNDPIANESEVTDRLEDLGYL